MFKIKLIKNAGYMGLENEVNNFIKNKVVLEVDVKGVDDGYLAVITYREISPTSLTNPTESVPEVKPVMTSPDEATTPFDILSRGGTLTDEGN